MDIFYQAFKGALKQLVFHSDSRIPDRLQKTFLAKGIILILFKRINIGDFYLKQQGIFSSTLCRKQPRRTFQPPFSPELCFCPQHSTNSCPLFYLLKNAVTLTGLKARVKVKVQEKNVNIVYTTWQAPVCKIILAADEIGLIHLHLDTGQGTRKFAIDPTWSRDDKNDILRRATAQLEEYFTGKRDHFDLPVHPRGTDFQQRVWHALEDIPFGETRSYKEIAVAIGNPKSARAVGAANGKNPLPLVIPCHRVVGATGKLTGFAHGLEIKAYLLQLEQSKKS